MKDYLVRGLVNSKNCRVFACQTTNLLEKARQEHDLWPTASAALGRMMSATLMMAAMNKNNENSKLKYIFYEIYNEKSDDIEKVYSKLINITKNNDNKFIKLKNLIGLIEKKKIMSNNS